MPRLRALALAGLALATVLSEADVVVEPFVGDVGYDDFSQAKRLIEAGEEAARAALPRIRAALAAKQRPAR